MNSTVILYVLAGSILIKHESSTWLPAIYSTILISGYLIDVKMNNKVITKYEFVRDSHFALIKAKKISI